MNIYYQLGNNDKAEATSGKTGQLRKLIRGVIIKLRLPFQAAFFNALNFSLKYFLDHP
jgi:hypothetical protein